MNNRLGNTKNPFQRSFKKVLCLCSAGLLRSPTAAVVLTGPPFNYNTRCAGVTREFALIPMDEVLITWADEIVCMQKAHAAQVLAEFPELKTPIIVLDIADDYPYRDPELMQLIYDKYLEARGVPKDGIPPNV